MFRAIAAVVVIGTIGISAVYRFRARRAGATLRRRDEPAALKLGRAVISLPLFASVLAYLIEPSWMAWAAIAVPEWARWIAAAIGVCLIPMALWVFRSLGSNVSETVLTRDAQRLVTAGPYRWIRHPLYATGGLLFVVTGLIAANAMILALAIVALVLIVTVVIPREEAALVGRFGDDYRTYMRHTGRLLPRWPRD